MSKQGCKIEIIKYENCHNILVKIYDGYNTMVRVTYENFKKGNVESPHKPSTRKIAIKSSIESKIGKIVISNKGVPMKIIKCINSTRIIIEFQDEHKGVVETSYSSFISKQVKNPYQRSVHGVGYLGQGKHVSRKGGKILKCYGTWSGMIERGYNQLFKEKNPSYKNTTVCEEWHNFQVFGDWYDENYYQIEGKKMSLDKDILVKGNKLYSPETCIIVPSNINNLFVTRKDARGKFPIGVTYDKEKKSFVTQYNTLSLPTDILGHRFIGYYSTPKLAFNAYKEYKEKYIKKVADYYKKDIPEKLYRAMYNYEVEITD